MDNLILLYIIMLRSDVDNTESGVGRTELSRYLGVSYNSVKSYIEKTVKEGLVYEMCVSQPTGLGYAYKYRLTENGNRMLSNNGDLPMTLYRAWRDMRTAQEIKTIRKMTEKPKSKKSKKEESGGQKKLW